MEKKLQSGDQRNIKHDDVVTFFFLPANAQLPRLNLLQRASFFIKRILNVFIPASFRQQAVCVPMFFIQGESGSPVV